MALFFPEMLVEPAKQAGISVPVPENLDNYSPDEHPHWTVFCNMQLGAPMPRMGCHWDNAHIVAGIPIDKITTVTYNDIIALGFEVGCPTP